MLTFFQKKALDALYNFLRLKRNKIEYYGMIRVRCAPLIIGPSGVGKNHVVSTLAEDNDIPLTITSSRLWAPRGSREKPNTLNCLENFIEKNKEGIILLDEINKLHDSFTSCEYTGSIILEHMALLDGDEKLPFATKIRKKLRENFLLIGAGAWQDTHREKPEIGFVGEEKKENYAQKVQAQPVIPEELMLRFNSDLIFIPHPTEGEIIEILKKSKLLPRKASKREVILREVMASNCPIRTIEALATKAAFGQLDKIERRKKELENFPDCFLFDETPSDDADELEPL